MTMYLQGARTLTDDVLSYEKYVNIVDYGPEKPRPSSRGGQVQGVLGWSDVSPPGCCCCCRPPTTGLPRLQPSAGHQPSLAWLSRGETGARAACGNSLHKYFRWVTKPTSINKS